MVLSVAEPKQQKSVKDYIHDKVAMSQASLKFFCRDVLKIDFEPHHREWYRLIKTDKLVLVEASRDSGKTWFFAFAYPLWRGIFNKIDICLISYSYDQSVKLTEHIKRELETNEFFKQALPKRYQDTWTKTELILANGTTIRSESFGSSVRGGHYDLIIIDDPLKDYGGMNREDQHNFFYGVVMPALKPNGQIVVVGTPIDFTDLLADIEGNKSFKTYYFPAIKEDGSLLWEDRYNKDRLDDRRKTIGSWLFAREYLLKRVSSDTAPLKIEHLKFEEPDSKVNLDYYLAIDPAISTEETADHSAIVVGGIDKANNLYLAETIKARLEPSALIKEIFRLYDKWKPVEVGLETVSFQKVLKMWMVAEMERLGIWLPIKELKTSGRTKQMRIMGLQPRMEGRKLFIKNTMTEFISEVERFRLEVDGSDDLLDATAYLNEMIPVINEAISVRNTEDKTDWKKPVLAEREDPEDNISWVDL